jgi:uncharacterized protein
MTTFAVIRDGGPGWDTARPLREQEAWSEHAEAMDALADEGFVLLGGPIAGGPKTLLVFRAESESEVRRQLERDPWTPMGVLAIASVERWDVLLGRELVELAVGSLAT